MRQTSDPADFASEDSPVLRDEDYRPNLQAHYVARLRRLLQLRRDHLGELNQEGIWLLDRCIFATYCDCVEVGAGVAAQEVLRSIPSPEGPRRTPVGPSRRQRRSS